MDLIDAHVGEFMQKDLRSLVFLVFVLGLVFKAEARLRDPITTIEAQARLAQLNHVPWKAGDPVVETSAGSTWNCTKSDITIEHFDPIYQSKEEFRFRLVLPRSGQAPFPVVIIIPTIEGITPLEPSLAKSHCKEGVAAVIADVNDTRMPNDMPAWGIEDANDIRAIHRLRAIVDFLQSDSRIDGSKIGTVGLSLGGITASVFAAVEPRLQSVVITVGGGNLPAILTESDARHVRRLRDARLASTGISSLADYEEQLHKTIALDPIYVGQFIGDQRAMMIIADNDTKVPSKHQWALYDTIGKPQTLQYSGSHIWTLIDIVFRSADKVINFSKTKWGMPIRMWKEYEKLPIPLQGLPIY